MIVKHRGVQSQSAHCLLAQQFPHTKVEPLPQSVPQTFHSAQTPYCVLSRNKYFYSILSTGLIYAYSVIENTRRRLRNKGYETSAGPQSSASTRCSTSAVSTREAALVPILDARHCLTRQTKSIRYPGGRLFYHQGNLDYRDTALWSGRTRTGGNPPWPGALRYQGDRSAFHRLIVPGFYRSRMPVL